MRRDEASRTCLSEGGILTLCRQLNAPTPELRDGPCRRSFLLLASWARTRRRPRCWRPASVGSSDIAQRRNRRVAPHAAACSLRFALGTLQLLNPGQRQPRADPCETFAHQQGIHELAVFGVHIRQVPVVRVERWTILLQSNPSMQEQGGETVASLAPKRCTGLEPAAEFWRVDAEQAHPPNGSNVNGVAIDDESDQHRIRPSDPVVCRRCLKKSGTDKREDDQILHNTAPFPVDWRGWTPGVQARGPQLSKARPDTTQ